MRLWSRDRRIASAQRHTLMASLICVVWTLIAGMAWWLGKVPTLELLGLMAFNVGGMLIFNTAIWTGWSQRFKDFGLTQAQMIFAVMCMCGIYVVVPQMRAAAIQSMCLAMVFSTFSLTDRQCIRLGKVLASIPLLTVLALFLARGLAFSMSDDGVPAIGGAVILLIMSRLLSHFCRLRASLNTQRDELRAMAAEVEEQARTDELTGLFNRRHMTDKAELALGRHRRSTTPLCLALLDVDHFKRVNDEHGHHIGDEVLIGVAQALKRTLRVTDLVARWGGEEILVLLPDADAEAAKMVLDRVLELLKGSTVSPSKPALRITFSTGVVQWDQCEPLKQLIHRADQAMYQAKASGRAKCVIGVPTPVCKPAA